MSERRLKPVQVLVVDESPGLLLDIAQRVAECGYSAEVHPVSYDEAEVLLTRAESGTILISGGQPTQTIDQGVQEQVTTLVHDLNNALSAVEAYSAFVLDGLSPAHPSFKDASVVVASGKRASELVAKLRLLFRAEGALGAEPVTSAVWPRAKPRGDS